MLRAAELVRDGANLTTAATDAGFASPSHFSDSFRAMFGLRPGQLLASEIDSPESRPANPCQPT